MSMTVGRQAFRWKAQDGAASAPARAAALRQSLLICLVAILMFVPELSSGLSITDSVSYNIVWADQFREQFHSGELYPRILHRSWSGLGSPTFYFYPPLYFWAVSLADLLSFGLLSTERLVSLTSLAFMMGSGLAMRRWLAPIGGSSAACVGAIAYMLGPYHLFDIFARGAVAEAASYAFLPLILISLRALGPGDRNAAPLLAISYAGLVLTHLPTALLTTLFVIPPYVLFEARRSSLGGRRYASEALLGGALGLGLAAIYLIPALTLLGHVSSEALFSAYYGPQNWFFWRPEAWPASGSMVIIMPVAVASLALAAAAAWSARTAPVRADALLWFGICAFAFIMVAGLFPFLWDLPLLAQVQFPWRLLLIAEFAAITALAAGKPRLTNPLLIAGAVPAIAATFISFSLVPFAAREAIADRGRLIAEIRSFYRDAPEYLPAGFPIPMNPQGGADRRKVVLPRASSILVGGRLAVDAAEAQRVEAPLFYFPSWKVSLAGSGRVATAKSARGLLSWNAPAGKSTFIIEAAAPPQERIGRLVSLAAVFGLILTLFGNRRRRKGDFALQPR